MVPEKYWHHSCTYGSILCINSQIQSHFMSERIASRLEDNLYCCDISEESQCYKNVTR